MKLQGHHLSPVAQPLLASWAMQGVLVTVLALGLVGFPARAANAPPASPKWAVLPLVVVGGEGKEAKHFQSLYESEVSKSGIDRIPSKQVNAFLAKDPGCARTDECLARLATALGADRTLLVTLSPFAKEMILTSKVVSSKGAVLHESASTVTRGSKESAVNSAREAFQTLLGDLQTDIVPLAPVAETQKPAPPPQEKEPKPSTPSPTQPQTGTPPQGQGMASQHVVPPPPAVGSQKPPAPATPSPGSSTSGFFSGRTGNSTAGLGLGAGGVVAIGTATGLFIASTNTWKDVHTRYLALPRNGFLYPTQEQVNTLHPEAIRARNMGIASTLCYAVGGAAIVTGAILFLTDKHGQPQVSMSVAVSPSSAALTFQFP